MTSLIKKYINKFFFKRKIKQTTSNNTICNEKIIKKMGDDADYDGMGNYGRFPPQKSRK